jgi:hypothetical protein
MKMTESPLAWITPSVLWRKFVILVITLLFGARYDTVGPVANQNSVELTRHSTPGGRSRFLRV